MRAGLDLGNVMWPVVALAFWKRHCCSEAAVKKGAHAFMTSS